MTKYEYNQQMRELRLDEQRIKNDLWREQVRAQQIANAQSGKKESD